jgi:hypothetical protein
MRLAKTGTLVAGLIAGATLSNGASAYTYHVLYNFGAGFGPPLSSGMVSDPSGVFYNTAQGGKNGYGYVYKLFQSGTHWKVEDIYDFTGYEGELGLGLIEDTAGNLYGLSFTSGKSLGKLFELSPPPAGQNNWTETSLATVPSHYYTIRDRLTYAGQSTGLAYDGVSPLYDMTDAPAGAHGRGAAFSITQTAGVWSFTDIYDFCSTGRKYCTDGADPHRGLTMDAAGNLYGVTGDGGAHHSGVAFELSPPAAGGTIWTETVLYSFCSVHYCLDGSTPGGDLLLDSSTGTFYGLTGLGGERPCKKHWERGCEGVIFSLTPNGGGFDYAALSTFCQQMHCADGARPESLLRDASGMLFGVTEVGGNVNSTATLGAGTVFSFSGGSRQRLDAFCKETDCDDGYLPDSPLVMDASGDLFGTVQNGGTLGNGVIYELTP